MRVWLEHAPWRVECRDCGVHVEQLTWAAHGSRFTLEFEELTAYLAQITDKTSVTRQMGISWRTVGTVVDRVVARSLEEGRLMGLRMIGVDEFSYRKRHNYVTTVVDHEARRVVWAGEGAGYETLKRFFEDLGEEGRKSVEKVTADMAHGYTKAIEEFVPEAEIVYDRFHVQRLASEAVDKVRREQLRDLRGTSEGSELFKSRFALLKNPWNLSRKEKQKLSAIQANNAGLYRAYLLKEALASALDYRQPKRAKRALKEWLAWASRSRLEPFVKLARTIRKRMDRILAYITLRLTNGIVEGINTKMRMVARRAFGFHSAQALISMVFLCAGGINLDPPLP